MRVFICSTCYDLTDLRAELKEFFQEAGVEPVLSDSLDSEFQILSDRNSIETCLANVRNCDEFLIILSLRYGPSLAKAGFDDVSASHLEYREAVKSKKPIRMFVRDRLEADYAIWQNNKENPDLKLSWCKERKDWNIFLLLEEHRRLTKESAKNNWVCLYRDSAELKRHLTHEFKETFAHVAALKLMENGRVPFFEITGRFTMFNPQAKSIAFALQIRNIGNVVAVSPRLEILNTTNKWDLRSLAGQEQITQDIQWAYQGSVISLSTRLSYSILEGQKFADEGVLTITLNAQNFGGSNISYEIKKRHYLGAATEMVLT
jgi:hypothetical protein